MKLTLKDLFAMNAMKGILERGDGDPIAPAALAAEAWEIAFAMWAKREELSLTSSFNDSAFELEVEAIVQNREF